MSSIIEGYNYDIFISYRQKDNKGDHWVSEFVEALKTELGSTFKEEISVYYDINPHDGLLETHDVDASLKEKLKCLIFIPIISRTYCDPKSFAWEHEFKAFVNMASKDQFGLKVKLPNGNVTSRVLPVRIHDLDQVDIKECEAVLGSVLRGIEFIYKESGVNRPLRLREEKHQNNLNNSVYRDQLNKVANSIKDTIKGIENETLEIVTTSNYIKTKDSQPKEKSIIVLPFENMSPDPDQEYFSDGLTEEIITDLAHIKDLLVISRSSAMTFKGTKKTIPEIASTVNVRYVLEGSVRKAGNKLRITAQLIDAANDTHIWAEKYDGLIDDVFEIQEKVSMSIVSQLKIKLTPEEKSRVIEKAFNNIRAFEIFLKGKLLIYSFSEQDIDNAIELFKKALEIEGENSAIYAQLAHAYYQIWNFGIRIDENDLIIARGYIRKAFEIDEDSPDGLFVSALLEGSGGGNAINAISLLKKALKISPNHADSLGWLTIINCVISSDKNEDTRYLERLYQIDPYFPLINIITVISNLYRGDFEKMKVNALTLSNGDLEFFIRTYALLFSGDSEKAIESYNILSKGFTGSYPCKVVHLMLKILMKAPYDENFLKDEKLILWARNDFQYSHIISEVYALLGKPDEALDWLENSVNHGFLNYPFLSHIDPLLENIRNEGRFKKLMGRVKDELQSQ